MGPVNVLAVCSHFSHLGNSTPVCWPGAPAFVSISMTNSGSVVEGRWSTQELGYCRSFSVFHAIGLVAQADMLIDFLSTG